jgi:hypothetical protein
MYSISAVFSMFINDLCSCIHFSKFHMYADDLQIYLSGNKKDFDEMIFVLNENLLNPRKSQVIPILNFAVGMVLSSLFLGSAKIPWCDAVTDLGVVIDGRLYATLHILRLLKFLIPKRVRLKLCKALLLPYLFYSTMLFFCIYPP